MPQPTTQPLKNLATAILLTGLVAGTLDITAAFIQYYINTGHEPARLLRIIAIGVFGKEALTGGTIMAAWGLLFHFAIAFGLTIFYFWLYPKVKWLGENKIIAGVSYAIFAWLVTTQLIVPLSKIGKQPFVFSKAIIAIAILIVCIGLPISLMTNKHYLYKK